MNMLSTELLSVPFAHRAYHDAAAGRIENSLAAVKAAVAEGYGIEIDIQPAACGTAMVFHDTTLDRLTARSGPITAHNASTLRETTLSGMDEGIPTLSDVLEAVAGRVPLLIEVKYQPEAGPLEQAVAEALQGYGGPVAMMSFSPDSVAAFAEAAPNIARGLTTGPYYIDDFGPRSDSEKVRLRDIADYDRLGASFISHSLVDLDLPRVAELKAAGAIIQCWTVRSAEQEARARQIVHNITFEGYAAAKMAP